MRAAFLQRRAHRRRPRGAPHMSARSTSRSWAWTAASRRQTIPPPCGSCCSTARTLSTRSPPTGGTRPNLHARRRHQSPRRRADQRRRCVRQRLLRHHPARGRGDGSAATPAPADGVARAGKRHPRPARAGRFQHRSVRRRDGQRMGPSAHARLPRDHRAGRFGQRLLHDREPAVLPARPQRPEPRGGHRVLVVVGRSASGRAGAAQRRMRPGDRRRRQPHTDPGAERLLYARPAWRRRTAAANRSAARPTESAAARASPSSCCAVWRTRSPRACRSTP